MKKIIIFLLALSFCIVFSACGQNTTVSDINFETVDLSGMTFEIPDTWEEDNSNTTKDSVRYNTPYGDGSLFGVMIFPGSPDMDFSTQETRDEFISSFAKMYGDIEDSTNALSDSFDITPNVTGPLYAEILTEECTIAGNAGLHHVYTSSSSGQNIQYDMYATSKNNYIISYMGAIDALADEKMKNEFSDLIAYIVDSSDFSQFPEASIDPESSPAPTQSPAQEEDAENTLQTTDNQTLDPSLGKDVSTLRGMFIKNVTNDVTGNWREFLYYGNMDFSEYVLSYYNEYFESDSEVHFVINYTAETTTRINCGFGVLYASVYKYVDGEENDAKMLPAGDLIEEYTVNIETGKIEKE